MRIGNLLMVLGGIIALIGVLVRFAPGVFGWFGNLPGDIRIESENVRVFIPLGTMIVLSLLATLVLNLIGRGR